jgi:hypothetical protein
MAALAIWLVSPVAAEVAYRSLGAEPPTELAGLYEQLPDRNYAHRPWVDADANWFVAKFSVHTDGLGFRCDSERRVGVRPGQQLDFLIVGDSQAYGQGVEFDGSVAGTLIQQAAKDGIRGANAATGGHYLRNQFELVRRLRDHSGVRVKRYVLFLTPYLLAAPDAMSRVTVGPDGRLYGSAVTPFKRAMIEIKTRTVLYAKIRDALRYTLLPPQMEAAATSMFVNEFATGDVERRRLDRLVDTLKAFRDWAAEEGALLQLVYTPLAMEFDFEPLRQAARVAGVQIDQDSPYRTAAVVADRLDLPLADLREVIGARHESGEVLTLSGDPHYNEATSIAAGMYSWAILRPSFTNAPVAHVAEHR